MNIKTLSLLVASIITTQNVKASVSTLIYQNAQHITYVGTEHSYDPKDTQYATLTNAWNDFLQKTGGQNCCVIIEQPTIPTLTFSSLEHAITHYGDCGAAYYCATNAGIPLLAGDPLVRLGFPLLVKEGKWNTNYIHYVCFLQQLELRLRTHQSLKESSQPILEAVEKSFRNIFPETSIDSMVALHEKITGRVFNPYDHHFFKFITYYPPMKSLRGLFLYRFAALKEIRDIVFNYHLKREIATIALVKQQILEGKHIFIVYGNAHEAFHVKALQVITKGTATQESAKKLYANRMKHIQSGPDTEDVATIAGLLQAIQ